MEAQAGLRTGLRSFARHAPPVCGINAHHSSVYEKIEPLRDLMEGELRDGIIRPIDGELIGPIPFWVPKGKVDKSNGKIRGLVDHTHPRSAPGTAKWQNIEL